MRNVSILVSVSLLALVGCGATQPPRELVDARSAYSAASQGPAAQSDPASLHTAKQALDKAEKSFADDGDDVKTRDLAYIAVRKSQLADSSAKTAVAIQQKQMAEAQAQQIQAESLRTAQGELANTRNSLSKTQDQLDSEKRAREEAEKKAATALADLQKIASVKQESRGMVITLSGSVLFASDQATLLPAAIVKVNEVADALLKGNRDSNITIEGHTDSQGSREHNMDLARRRAEAVKAQLVQHGVASDRVKTVGVGPDRPVADNKSAEGRANNRRVEVIVEPSSGGGMQGSSGASSTTNTNTTTGSGR